MPETPLDIVLAYHAESTHHPHRFAPSLGYMDWDTQPNPFRHYQGAPRIVLPLLADRLPSTWAECFTPNAFAPFPITPHNLGLLLEIAMGLSAWKAFGQNRWALRCNPSSGNLHPTEAYLLAPALGALPPGLYHYLPLMHLLEHRAAFTPAGLPPDGALLGLSNIHWREAWKYGLRAYRYCQHDTGHALGALRYAAAALGWHMHPLWDWADAKTTTLLGLGRSAEFHEAEQEEPDLLCWISSNPAPPVISLTGLLASLDAAVWHGQPNQLSPEHVHWEGIHRAARACQKPRTHETSPSGAVKTAPTPLPPMRLHAPDTNAAALFRRRRSAVDYDGHTGISAGAFFDVMDALLPRPGAPPFDIIGWAPKIHPFLFVHRVENLPSGLYALIRSQDALPWFRKHLSGAFAWTRPEGAPAHLPLYLLAPGDFRDWARSVSCGQDIAADSAFALAMLGDLGALAQGAYWYRRLHWEAGLLGQALYLWAETLGLRATGIGCFFDDDMHNLLGRKDPRFATLYHFTLGGPVEDARLQTLPPYAHRTPEGMI